MSSTATLAAAPSKSNSLLRLVAAGASNREIGSPVHLSPAAIKDRLRRSMDRPGARRRAELAAHALRLGIA